MLSPSSILVRLKTPLIAKLFKGSRNVLLNVVLVTLFFGVCVRLHSCMCMCMCVFTSVILQSQGKCSRCGMVCLDQNTGEKTSEPLRTLAAWRGGKVIKFHNKIADKAQPSFR